MPDDLPNRSAAEAFLGPNEVLILEEVVTAAERDLLIAWVDAAVAQDALLRNPRAPGSYSTPYLASDGGLTRMTGSAAPTGAAAPVWVPEGTDRVPPLPGAFWTIRDRVIARLGLAEVPEDPYKGSFLNHVAEGGAVHRHVDARIDFEGGEAMILRCNVLFRRPPGGGEPVIGGRKFAVPERGGWAFYATEVDHLATAVEGAVGRSTLSFGFAVTPERMEARRFRVTPALARAFAAPESGMTPAALIGQMAETPAFREVGPARIAAVSAMLSAQGVFALSALGIEEGPEPVLWPVARQLQAAGLIESLSQSTAPGAVHVV